MLCLLSLTHCLDGWVRLSSSCSSTRGQLNRFNEPQTKVKLTQLLTEGSTTMHPRWLVLFPDNHMEEVYEHRFGKILNDNKEDNNNDDNNNAAAPESRRSSASNSPVPPEAAASSSNHHKPPKKTSSPTSMNNINNSSSGKNSPSSETDPEGNHKKSPFPFQRNRTVPIRHLRTTILIMPRTSRLAKNVRVVVKP